jgi:hypothetical protein
VLLLVVTVLGPGAILLVTVTGFTESASPGVIAWPLLLLIWMWIVALTLHAPARRR